MSTRVESPAPIPMLGWMGRAAAVIAVGLLTNWAIATGLLIVLLVQVAQPLDVLMAFILVVGAAAFVRYEAGHLTLELSLVSVAILIMLAAYVFSNRGRQLRLARTPLTLPLLLYVGLSVANYCRGILIGNSLKFATVELIAVLALASTVLVANTFEPRRDLQRGVWGLLVIGLGSAALGLYSYSIVHVRGVYFTPVPGMIGMLPINLALRSKRLAAALGWTILSLPLFLNQFVSFTRGYWLGCVAGILGSVLIYAGLGRGSRGRWAHAGLVCGILVGACLAGAFFIAVAMGQSDFLELVADRFGSIADPKLDVELAGQELVSYNQGSVLTRMAEYGTALRRIGEAPWFGHGLGYTFLVQVPIGFKIAEQWYVHQNYLFVWLKQGVVGLVAFLWMIWAATSLGIRESRRRDNAWESAWSASAATSTIFLAVLALSNFHWVLVGQPFLLALLWGGTMAMANRGFVWVRWSAPDALDRGR